MNLCQQVSKGKHFCLKCLYIISITKVFYESQIFNELLDDTVGYRTKISGTINDVPHIFLDNAE